MKPDQEPVSDLTLEEAERYLEEGHFLRGSMGPKVKAASRFLRYGGHEVIICRPDQLMAAWEGHAGTRIVPG